MILRAGFLVILTVRQSLLNLQAGYMCLIYFKSSKNLVNTDTNMYIIYLYLIISNILLKSQEEGYFKMFFKLSRLADTKCHKRLSNTCTQDLVYLLEIAGFIQI